MYKEYLDIIAKVIGVISLLIVAYGALLAFIIFFKNELARFSNSFKESNIAKSRVTLGAYLLLGLEFLIASDIIQTIVDPSFEELIVLGGVVILRTILSVFLNKEIKEIKETEIGRD